MPFLLPPAPLPLPPLTLLIQQPALGLLLPPPRPSSHPDRVYCRLPRILLPVLSLLLLHPPRSCSPPSPHACSHRCSHACSRTRSSTCSRPHSCARPRRALAPTPNVCAVACPISNAPVLPVLLLLPPRPCSHPSSRPCSRFAPMPALAIAPMPALNLFRPCSHSRSHPCSHSHSCARPRLCPDLVCHCLCRLV